MSAPFIGSRISIIDQSDVRYEGVLVQIDAQNQQVVLMQVFTFGTETRPASKFVPPSPQMMPMRAFHSSDIKDLHVSAAPAPSAYFGGMPQQAPQAVQPPQPAPAASQAPPPPAVAAAWSQPAPTREAPAPAAAAASVEAPAADAHSRGALLKHDPVSAQRAQRAHRPRGELEALQPAGSVEEFDFESSNQRLDMQDLKKEIDQITPVYSKSSFFDNLSLTNDRMSNEDRQRQTRQNVETFGTTGTRPFVRGRGHRGPRRRPQASGDQSAAAPAASGSASAAAPASSHFSQPRDVPAGEWRTAHSRRRNNNNNNHNHGNSTGSGSGSGNAGSGAGNAGSTQYKRRQPKPVDA